MLSLPKLTPMTDQPNAAERFDDLYIKVDVILEKLTTLTTAHPSHTATPVIVTLHTHTPHLAWKSAFQDLMAQMRRDEYSKSPNYLTITKPHKKND